MVLVCVCAVLGSAAALVGCGSSASSSQTPKQTMQAFLAAYQKADTDTTWNLLAAETQKALKTKATWASALKTLAENSIKFTVGKVTVNGNKATVSVTGTGVTGKTVTETMPLYKENGAWKVYLVGAGAQ